MKTLYEKASYLWSTLAGLNLEKKDPNINKVLEENRPALADKDTVCLTQDELNFCFRYDMESFMNWRQFCDDCLAKSAYPPDISLLNKLQTFLK